MTGYRSSHLFSSTTTTTSSTTSSSSNNSSTKDEDDISSSSSSSSSKSKDKKEKKKSLRDSVNRITGDNNNNDNDNREHKDNDESKSDSKNKNGVSFLSTAWEELQVTWTDLIESDKPQDIDKKIHVSHPGNSSDDDNEAAKQYELMIIDPQDHMNAFERIQKRLSDAPIIQDILSGAEKVYTRSGADKAKQRADEIKEDAQEAWDTSQNPWVYRISSVYDTMTEESELAMTERLFRELDPDFSLESWRRDCVEVTLPRLMALFLEGRVKELEPQLGEAVYKRIAAEAKARKKEGVYVDTNVLGIMNSEILSCQPPTPDNDSPTIVLHFMCQQINCVRKKDDPDTIVEGSEDDIKAYSYVVAFRRDYIPETGELKWKVVDFMLNGAIAYL